MRIGDCSFRRVLFSQTVSTFFQMTSYYYMFLVCFYAYWWYLRMSSISRYSAVLQSCYLYFSRMFLFFRLTPHRLFWSSQTGRQFLCWHFWTGIFFCSVFFPSNLYGCSHQHLQPSTHNPWIFQGSFVLKMTFLALHEDQENKS